MSITAESSSNGAGASSTQTSPTTSPTTSTSPITNERLINEARAVLQASMQNIGSRLDNDLSSRARDLHSNSAAISKQEKNLGTAVKGLAKETDKLKKMADEAGRKVKELGNVQNWAEVLEREFLVLEETMRLVAESDYSESEGELEDCKICGKGGEDESFVFCDGYRAENERCDAPFHLECLGLKEVPVGDWFCPDCKSGMAGLRREGVGAQKEDTAVVENGQQEEDVEMGGTEAIVAAGSVTAPLETASNDVAPMELDHDMLFDSRAAPDTSDRSTFAFASTIQHADGTWS